MFLDNKQETETARINRLIFQGGLTGMTEPQFFAAEIKDWRDSKRRKEQMAGSLYYEGKQDILQRQRTIIGEDGKVQVVQNLPNNKLVDNQFALMVDQKTNYLVGKPFSMNCENKAYVDILNTVFNRRFRRLLKYVCEDALLGGIGWLYPYYNERGELAFKHFPAHEILPFWADDDHTILDCAIRLYAQEVWNGYQKETVERVEIFKADGLWRYIFKNDILIPDVEAGEHESYFAVSEGEEETLLNWDRIPLIPFKYNKREIPLLNRVKSLQDGINTLLSDFENNMQEDARNTILVLKNYDGQNLGEFRRNLATYGAVKVREDGGVETLSVEVNAENYKSILELLKKALINNARGYDAKDDRMGSNPNQMNIQSMYSDIDLDANGMETEFQQEMKEGICFGVGVVGSAIASLFGGWDAALVTLLIFMGIDYLTGLIVAGVFHQSPKSEGGALESRAGWKGLCRKGVTLLIVLVGCRLDVVMGSNFIRDAVVIAFIANETLSIIENAGLMGLPIPAVITKAIEVLKKKAESEEA